jgi:protoporphyrinogen oxidase
LKVVIVGAGVMGLSAALDLLDEGHDVTLLEAAETAGGLAGSFDFGGAAVEKFYHFLCGADRVYFRWLDRLGLSKKLRWRRTSMAVLRDGRLHSFGDPLSLLGFSPLSLGSRIRYGLHVLAAKRRTDWKALEGVPAREWLVEGGGEEAYRVVWEPLLRQKFGDETDSISAAWIWSRVHRLASSRDRLFREWLGFLEGGSDVFVEALVRAISSKGGRIELCTPVEHIHIGADGSDRDRLRAEGVRAGGREFPADAVISTIPLSFLLRIAPELPASYREAALDLGNVGVRCIVLKLERPLTPYFWINVNDELPVCGLIEYTNLNPPAAFQGRTLVYSPLYVPASSPRYGCPDEEVLAETVDSISRIEPRFGASGVVDYRVFREPYAQPVCPVGFTGRLAPIRTPVANLFAADTTHLLPHDRSISDSIALAERLLATLRDPRSEGNRRA